MNPIRNCISKHFTSNKIACGMNPVRGRDCLVRYTRMIFLGKSMIINLFANCDLIAICL